MCQPGWGVGTNEHGMTYIDTGVSPVSADAKIDEAVFSLLSGRAACCLSASQ